MNNILNTDISMKLICCTCLSFDRKLQKLYKITDGVDLLYSLLSFDNEAFKEVFYKDIASLHVCWECRAIMRRMKLFRLQASRAFRELSDICEGRTNKSVQRLSNLSTYTITDCDNIIHEASENFVDCGVEIKSDIGDDVPLSELLSFRDTFEDQNDDYISECDNCDIDILELNKTTLKSKKAKPTANGNKVLNETLSVNKKAVANALKCDSCGIAFDFQNALDEHNLNIHRKKRKKNSIKAVKPSKVPYPCRECNLSFDHAKKRWIHVQKTHIEKHKCSICTKTFAFKSNLLKHEKNHVSPPPREECPVCHKMIRIDILKVHALTHTDRQTFTCVTCDKKFISRDTYDNHLKYSKAHAKEDLKRYECPTCNKRYRFKTELRDHINYQHKSQTEHKCPVCEKGLATKRCVRRHIKRAHEGIKENTRDNICQRCGKSFTEKKRLREHEYIHSGERPLSCELCGHTFRQRASLYTHRKRVHKLVVQHKSVTVLGKEAEEISSKQENG